MKLGNIQIGSKKGFFSHNVDVDNNTTAGFGFTQPLFSKFLEKDEAFKLNFTQEVLLSPTVCPSYARMSVYNQGRFVPMCDIYPAFDALLSHLPINGNERNYIPSSVPFIHNRTLLHFIFKNSRCTIYKLDSADGIDWSVVPISLGNTGNSRARAVLENLGLYWSSVGSFFGVYTNDHANWENVSFESADFVLLSDSTTEDGTQTRTALCVQMSSDARRLYKIFKGLGYSLSVEDEDKLSFLPLLAYYKAWFDSYAPQRFVNWHLTNCYKIINRIYNIGISDIEEHIADGQYNLFNSFFEDLSACFYSYPSDYISAHTITPVNDVPSTSFSMQFPGDGIDIEHHVNDITNNQGQTPYVGPFADNQNVLNNYTLRALTFMAKFVQKNSVIGGRISQYIRNHYGMDVSDDMFKDSTNLGVLQTECSIEKVLSTADTSQEVNGQQVGEKIGSYAGFGRGASQTDIDFTAPACGFYIILTSVVPFTSYCQGNGNDLYMLDRYTFPSKDFDALGLELTPRHSIIDSAIADGQQKERQNMSFGWIPRQSKYKVFKNILNGCMSFRSTQNSYLPYCFDKIIREHEIEYSSADKVRIKTHDVPNASVEWRFCNKYPWLSFWNRIFYNAKEDFGGSGEASYLFNAPDDNFIIQTRLNGTFKSKLMPLSQSFDLVDEDDDNTKEKITVD